MKKKVLAIVLVAVLCVGLLAGCGKDPAPSTSGGSNVSGDPVELSVWVPVYQFAEDGISDADFWNEKFDAFEAEHNCVINVEIQTWADYRDLHRHALRRRRGSRRGVRHRDLRPH